MCLKPLNTNKKYSWPKGATHTAKVVRKVPRTWLKI